ncbi:hypothetical protein FIU89_03570 [Roseovarius sp. THAF27]|uniref:Uncharacterized protein n=2 Tax=Sulfitobacter TaxID=60136 RepID=A0A1J0WIW5_9RHOB|nr:MULTISPECIES: hypothetical protein [Roseobacteraceae]APE44258.1 hypothetical protein BOO69_13265 [Sulfitobacter alexandrii]QFT47579.1 hypothetical protein FIU97_13445 [Roseivivax sp. THAF40]QFT79677.1 hypothetical protein FIU89_03570 [Roseovarius sp. THAF27]UOA15595.1 hypothetical protein DSM109990_02438 [Sulfitobacter dubius]
MPDLILNLSHDLFGRLCELARDDGVSAETLARQTITLKVGCNPSSGENPISTGFLRRHADDVLAIADREPVYLKDSEDRKFVLVSSDYDPRLLSPASSEG